jgi:hypothetical protein
MVPALQAWKGWLHDLRRQASGVRGFHMRWLTQLTIGDEWFPARCKMILTETEDGRIFVHVDPAFPNAWRREPYYSQLKAHVPVEIRIGCRCIDLLSEREVVPSPGLD